MTHKRLRKLAGPLLSATLISLTAGLTLPPASAWGSPGRVDMAEDSPSWTQLSAEQRRVLQPLAAQWDSMDETSRGKWATVALQYKRLSAAEQRRVDERLAQWVRLAPKERGEARLRFQQTREWTPEERQRRWNAYQALSEDERRELARQAQRRAQPTHLPDKAPGPRDARELERRQRQAEQQARKSNDVPPALPLRSTGKAVTPATVKAASGATTRLVTEQPAPPLHQHAGLPKIAATEGFVDPVTLLPRKGPQSAGMVPPPAPRDGKGRDQPEKDRRNGKP
ncbi:DUF3106 domain-containing protein [Aquabacterium fontiphilum]|uniref:DUF3106 domain-containing protein n=1 Tax=Aquabacterium fontiphilum TaxID=450365 RepID=UPI001376C11C|nr:DUF3106 domain-containing protein [Aquabacterium fontiphilum]